MPGNTCIVCANTRKKDPSVSFFRVPKEKTKRLRWLKALELKDGDVSCHHRVCSRHFPGGDAQPHDPQLSLGKRFASPKKAVDWSSKESAEARGSSKFGV